MFLFPCIVSIPPLTTSKEFAKFALAFETFMAECPAPEHLLEGYSLRGVGQGGLPQGPHMAECHLPTVGPHTFLSAV